MPTLLIPSARPLAGSPRWLAALAAAAQAEKADRSKPMMVEADQPGTVDLQRQVVVFNGNVVITQGTMVIRADRIELRETPDGYRAASAIGSAGKPASYRQKRDGVDENVEGAADRIEYDGRADTLRFVGNGAVRRLRGGTVADEITGGVDHLGQHRRGLQRRGRRRHAGQPERPRARRARPRPSRPRRRPPQRLARWPRLRPAPSGTRR